VWDLPKPISAFMSAPILCQRHAITTHVPRQVQPSEISFGWLWADLQTQMPGPADSGHSRRILALEFHLSPVPARVREKDPSSPIPVRQHPDRRLQESRPFFRASVSRRDNTAAPAADVHDGITLRRHASAPPKIPSPNTGTGCDILDRPWRMFDADVGALRESVLST
jgi:hypothetical protein